ncbi:MAG: hypothetical protein GY765_10410 [bacterium]|nr:hypothetical protein [bacterium]
MKNFVKLDEVKKGCLKQQELKEITGGVIPHLVQRYGVQRYGIIINL